MRAIHGHDEGHTAHAFDCSVLAHEARIRALLRERLTDFSICPVERWSEFHHALNRSRFGIAVVQDIESRLEELARLGQHCPHLPMVLVTSRASHNLRLLAGLPPFAVLLFDDEVDARILECVRTAEELSLLLRGAVKIEGMVSLPGAIAIQPRPGLPVPEAHPNCQQSR